ncbi:hypothetical protein PLICRDRAFT_39309 [Plicaturopsis crispa FD-325 SS-3]|nr:hypothetical protein PLICRDRAFT_39309 [Plicaturopsis crispa FD-325 SS-3]
MSSLKVDSSVGALEIGILVSLFLFGTTTVQAFVYFQRFPRDVTTLKLLVSVVWCLELLHTMAVSHSLYTETVTWYGREIGPNSKNPWSLNAAIVLSGLISPLVQAFFAHRVHAVSGQLPIPVFCWIVLFLRFVAIIILGIAAFLMTDLVQFTTQWRWGFYFVLIASAVVDVTIAVSLCYYLIQKRSEVMQSTARIIDRLITWTLQTSLVTCLTTVTLLISYVAMPNTSIWLGLFIILCRLFSNSLLASLNGRAALRPGRDVEAPNNVADLQSPPTRMGSQSVVTRISFAAPTSMMPGKEGLGDDSASSRSCTSRISGLDAAVAD